VKLYLTAASKLFLYCGNVCVCGGAGGGMWWNTTFCPKHKLYVNAHTDYKVPFFILYLFVVVFKRTIFEKKAWKHRSAVRCDVLKPWCVSLSLRLQTSSGSRFLRQFVSGNWSSRPQLSVSWELLRGKKRAFKLFKMLMIQHNEHLTDHKDRRMRLVSFISANTMLTSRIDGTLKMLSLAHCYSLTAPVGIATGWNVCFSPARNLWIESVHSRHTVSFKQEQLNIHLVRILSKLCRAYVYSSAAF